MLDKVCDLGNEVYCLGDLNIDWKSSNCPLKERLQSVTNACNLIQIVDRPTRICMRKDGHKSETCIDYIFTNFSHLCSKVSSVTVGCSDHNLVVVVGDAKVPKSGPKIVLMRSMKTFSEEAFILDIKKISWQHVLGNDDPDDALEIFNTLFLQVIGKHAPIRKLTVRNLRSPWLDTELIELVKQRDEAKEAAITSSFLSDWQIYEKLRNYVTALNKKKKTIVLPK